MGIKIQWAISCWLNSWKQWHGCGKKFVWLEGWWKNAIWACLLFFLLIVWFKAVSCFSLPHSHMCRCHLTRSVLITSHLSRKYFLWCWQHMCWPHEQMLITKRTSLKGLALMIWNICTSIYKLVSFSKLVRCSVCVNICMGTHVWLWEREASLFSHWFTQSLEKCYCFKNKFSCILLWHYAGFIQSFKCLKKTRHRIWKCSFTVYIRRTHTGQKLQMFVVGWITFKHHTLWWLGFAFVNLLLSAH